jgi:hypothetical protein
VTFDAFVDAVDERVRSLSAAEYGVYRGPTVAFWHQRDVSLRLRAGVRDDVELEITGPHARCVIEPCAEEATLRIAEAIAAELRSAPPDRP